MSPTQSKLFARPISHRSVIALIGFVLISFTWVAVEVFVQRDYQITVEAIERENSNLAKAFEEHVRRSLIASDNKLKLIKEEFERESAVTPAVRILLRPESFDPAVSQSGIMDSRGDSVASMRPDLSTPINAADREFFKLHRESANSGLIIDKPLRGLMTGKWSIIMTRRLNNPDGSFNGVVSAALLVDYFGQFYRQMELGEGKLVVLVGTDGIIRARQENEDLSSGLDVSRSELYQHAMKKPSGSILTTSTTDGQQRFQSYRVLPDYPLYVVVGVQKDAALAAYYQRRLTYLLFASFASLFILAAGYIMTRRRDREIETQKEIAASEEMLSKVFQASHDGISVLRQEDGLFYSVNQGFCRMTGYEPEELIGNTVKDIHLWVNPEDRRKMVALLNENGAANFEVQVHRKDGTERLWDGSWRLIEINEVLSVVAMVTDITDRRQAEREIADYRNSLEDLVAKRTEELQATNKDLEAFSYSVSHDLRAPLRSIHSLSKNLLEECGQRLDAEGRGNLTRVISSAEKMSILIDSLLQLSKVGRAQTTMYRVSLSKLVLESVEECQGHEPERNVEVIVEPGLCVLGDSQLLKIFFANLISNAWKYTGKKAVAKIEFGSTLIDGKTVYYVRDNGAGFDMEYVGKLFEPFQRLHRASDFPGTGIGLAIMARIIQRHEGKIWAEGVVGEGATFYFTLGG